MVPRIATTIALILLPAIGESAPMKYRPIDELSPNSKDLSTVVTLIDQGELESAQAKLLEFKSSSQLDSAWVEYLTGILSFAKSDFESGMKHFERPYTDLKSSPTKFDGDYHRVVAKCLKKIGWYYRHNKEYEKAFTNHSAAYQIYELYGAFAELHDAAISLDVDAYFLSDYELDEYWLRKSIDAGNNIPNDRRKNEALGISYNNLAGALYNMKRFADAEVAINESFKYWTAYEVLAGTTEGKVVWAHFGIGDVYQNWAQYLSEQGECKLCEEKIHLASRAYTLGLQILADRSGSADDKTQFITKMDEVAAISCRPARFR